MNHEPPSAAVFKNEQESCHRLTPETIVTLDLSGIPAKAQQAISAWLSQTDQQAIVNALAAMARRVDEEMHSAKADGTPYTSEHTSEIIVTPSLKSKSFSLFNQTDTTRHAA